MLGYDLYSSALADMLADPSLCMPITVGLFAKWGSGKSFLLSKLQDEMKAFTSQVTEPTFEFTWMLFWLVLLLVLPPSIMLSVHAESWKVGAVICASVFIVVYTLLAAVWYCTIKQASSWVYSASIFLAKQLNSLELILQVAFCNRPDKESQQSHCPVRCTWNGDTVLIVAAKTAHYDIIKLLLDRYADVNLCGNERKTALFHAVDRSHVDIVAAVLKANPDLEIATEVMCV
ncbi:PREDICTED: kinase D-interacting substrate of 220 kDa-like [Priapulus caudatus]|uniref:Kinase D-interacting substrate of 220 kDa-like n=1 Tax=Priapulus caudatus TaxID=37621 RepID=A0ABM1EEL4_PRICU|nr:PREDICTED: kinase D-interacting substrate of 220 kDa-like [Priapulus caudatus]